MTHSINRSNLLKNFMRLSHTVLNLMKVSNIFCGCGRNRIYCIAVLDSNSGEDTFILSGGIHSFQLNGDNAYISVKVVSRWKTRFEVEAAKFTVFSY